MEACGSDVNIHVNQHISFGEVGHSWFTLKRLVDQWMEEEEMEMSKAGQLKQSLCPHH